MPSLSGPEWALSALYKIRDNRPIAELQTAAPLVKLRLNRVELEAAVGPVGGARRWHRLESRVSSFNRDARKLGVKLSASRERGELEIAAPDAESLRRFQRELESRIGRIQRALARVLEMKLASEAGPGEISRLIEAGRAEAAGLLGATLPGFREIASHLGRVFVEPPFAVEGLEKGKGALDTVLRRVRRAEPGSTIVLGPSGSGKTALLARALETLAAGTSPVVWLSASRLRLKAGSPSGLDWEQALPGLSAGALRRLELLFLDGGLILIIDGLDENPALADWTEPGAPSFWTRAARNRCLLSCRELHFQRQVFNSPLQRAFGARLGMLRLLDWSAADAARLYAEAGLKSLAGLSPEVLSGRFRSMRLTPFSAWAFAALSSRRAGPRGEFELMQHLLELFLAWERQRLSASLPQDLAEGLLRQAAWCAYRNGFDRGALGELFWIKPRQVAELVAEHCPFEPELAKPLYSMLNRLPIVSFDGVQGRLVVDPAFAAFLAAERVVGAALGGDSRELAEILRTPFGDAPTRLLFQAIEALDVEQRRRFYRVGRLAFEEAQRRHAAQPVEESLLSMLGLMQIMGRLGLLESTEWLTGLLDRSEALPDRVFLACGRALALGGAQDAVTRFLALLRKRPGARDANCAFYLLWLKDGKPSRVNSRELDGLSAEGWPKTARWFITELGSRSAAPLRRIQLQTFLDLWDRYGAPEVASEALGQLLAGLGQEAARQPELAAELAPLRQRIQRVRSSKPERRYV